MNDEIKQIKIKNLDRLYEYRQELYKKPILRDLFLEVTSRCNARCEHCGSSCGDFIPKDERIITIADAAELKLSQEHVISLETRTMNYNNDSVVTIRDLVINALRMRPDRIVVGECRGKEAFDMMQAMNNVVLYADAA